ncbi:hypothetical protein AKJ09_07084 [Labilithrix luteola]|uniref:Uncharacterized protein n=1 Tax=Labilithrix luteola TaxID=1391654 RepID=A0A0K1Q3J8_9BACT|nr:hypothetical protein [Labilithrix luteola]AKV00421.1 hypothetical protein AKJ09_07084 [Labilithrix luteola]
MKGEQDPQRLELEDPEFARVVSALRSSGPSNDALLRTIGAVARVPAASAPVAPRRWLRLVPWAGLGVMVATLTAVGYERSKSHGPAEEHAPPAKVTTPVETSAPAENVEPLSVAATSTIRVDDLPSVAPMDPPSTKSVPVVKAPVSKSNAAPAETTAAPTARADAFRDELALVERARAQLSRGDSAEALRTLDSHRTQFPSGAFVQEVVVMRIEALAASGNAEAARAEGTQFLERHSTSPYAERVRSVLAKVK